MRKGFYIASESWWHSEFEDDIIEEIMICDHPKDGGTNDVFNVVFYSYINGPHLQIFPIHFMYSSRWPIFKNSYLTPRMKKSLGMISLTD